MVRQRKVPKRKATPLSASPPLRAGATCGARVWRGLAQLAPLRVAQTHASPDPPNPALLGASRGAKGAEHPHGPLLRSAQLAQRVALAPARRGRAQQRPEWMLAVRLSHPCWLRLRRGGCGVSMGVEAPMPRELTRRGCLNEAATQRSEFHGAPRNRHAAGLPLRTAKGSQTGGRLSFGYFSLAKQRKGPRPPGRLPASALNRGMRFNQRTKTNTTKSIATTAYPTSASSPKPLKQAPKPSAPKK